MIKSDTSMIFTFMKAIVETFFKNKNRDFTYIICDRNLTMSINKKINYVRLYYV